MLAIGIPLVFLVGMTTVAGVMGLATQIARQNWIVVAFGAGFLVLEMLVVLRGPALLEDTTGLSVSAG